MRSSRRRRGPVDHVVLAGLADDLADLQLFLDVASTTTYGQVLIEVPAGAPAPTLVAPARVSVMCVRPAAGDPPGTALARAMNAWLHEWMPEIPESDRDTTVWIAPAASAGMIELS